MSYPDPATTDWVPLWSAGPIAGYVPAARVYHSATQNPANSTTTLLSFDSERFDTDGIHDTVTNNSRLTCKTGGLYSIAASIAFQNAGVGIREVYLRLNGTTFILQDSRAAVSGDMTMVNVSTVYYLNPGDYVEVMVWQNNGGALAIAPNPPLSPEFSMVYLGPQVALGAVTPVNYGTTLPSAPADGQEAILVDSITNPTYQWRFRYNAGSSSAYKWEFIGGTPLYVEVPAIQNAASGLSGWQDLTTNGPQLTIPRSGDYDFAWGAYIGLNAAGWGQAGISIAGAAPVTGDTVELDGANLTVISAARNIRKLGMIQTVVVKLRYQTNTVNHSFGYRWLQITPVRVS